MCVSLCVCMCVRECACVGGGAGLYQDIVHNIFNIVYRIPLVLKTKTESLSSPTGWLMT